MCGRCRNSRLAALDLMMTARFEFLVRTDTDRTCSDLKSIALVARKQSMRRICCCCSLPFCRPLGLKNKLDFTSAASCAISVERQILMPDAQHSSIRSGLCGFTCGRQPFDLILPSGVHRPSMAPSIASAGCFVLCAEVDGRGSGYGSGCWRN